MMALESTSIRILQTTAICTAVFGVVATPALADASQPAPTGALTSAALASSVPAGETVWIKPTGSTYQMLRVWRSGSKLRMYRDEGTYPGDGTYCAWGTLRGKKFAGKEQRFAPDPVRVHYSFLRSGNRMQVRGLTEFGKAERKPWRQSSLETYFGLVPGAAGNSGEWCRTFKPMG